MLLFFTATILAIINQHVYPIKNVILSPIISDNVYDWLWENPPVTHKDNYLEKHN